MWEPRAEADRLRGSVADAARPAWDTTSRRDTREEWPRKRGVQTAFVREPDLAFRYPPRDGPGGTVKESPMWSRRFPIVVGDPRASR